MDTPQALTDRFHANNHRLVQLLNEIDKLKSENLELIARLGKYARTEGRISKVKTLHSSTPAFLTPCIACNAGTFMRDASERPIHAKCFELETKGMTRNVINRLVDDDDLASAIISRHKAGKRVINVVDDDE